MTLLYQEVSDGLGNCVFYISKDNLKVIINSLPHLFDEYIFTFFSLLLLLLLLHAWLLLRGVTHTWLVLGLRHYISSVIFVILVISEQVSLGVDDRLNDHSRLLSFNVQHFYYDVHDFWDHGRESLEDLVYDAVGDELKLRVAV